MKKVTRAWVAAALIGVSCGVGCNEKGATDSSANQAPIPFAPKIDLGPFGAHIPQSFQFPPVEEKVLKLLLANYGAVLMVRGGATPPPVIIFPDEDTVQRWQSSVKTERDQIKGIIVELQVPAMTAFLKARKEAIASGMDITPRGKDASRRSYADTLRLWKSRVKPGLAHWVAAGKLDAAEAKRIAALAPMVQFGEILHLEEQGLFFNLNFDNFVFASVAPPGASQHLSMLALDINEYNDSGVREILTHHGWYQTVYGDLPHFTYLGVTESELSTMGFKKAVNTDRPYWVPELVRFVR